MSVQNGYLPLASLASIGGGHLLRADAAASFGRLATAFRARFGYALAVTDAYRDRAAQERVKLVKGWLAATPGTSEHGWALALDLASSVNRASSREHAWMLDNAPAYGWVNPQWARILKPEPWHWEYVPQLDQHDGATLTIRPPQEIEEIMATPAEIAHAVLNSPHPEFGGRTLAQHLAQIRHEVNVNAQHLQGVVEGVKDDVLDVPISRAGGQEGTTNLRAVAAWSDAHTVALLEALKSGEQA